MKRIIFALTLLTAMTATAQTDWKKIDRLIGDGSYTTAYNQAAQSLTSASSPERLRAAWYMAKAAAMYQEDAYDSAEARYRTLLPGLAPLDQALCHAFLGEYEEALRHEALLQNTTVEQVGDYASGGKTQNMTPTVYDMIVVMMQDRADLTPQQRLDWQRRLVELHKDDNDDLRIWHDLRLHAYDRAVPNRNLQYGDLQHYINKYRGTKSPLYTLFHARMAEQCNGRGEYVDALRWCDSAIALFPKSEGGVQCANLRQEITRVSIDLGGEGRTLAPGRQSLVRVAYRNASHLYMRIVPYVENHSYDQKAKAKLLASKPLAEWEVAVPGNREYRQESALLALPAMKAGRYVLMVAPQADFRAQGFMAYTLNCTDMQLVQNGSEGLLLDRTTGLPIAGQELRMESNGTVLARATTDRDGRYRFVLDDFHWGRQLVAERDGYRLVTQFMRSPAEAENAMQPRVEVRTDRPIYKPGEEVQVALLAYRGDGLEASVTHSKELRLLLRDPNWQEVGDTLRLTTDDFGIASARFAIPTDRIAGLYTLEVSADGRTLSSEGIRVEEYKQPKFMVTLEPTQGAAPQFGSPCTVKGLAASYSAVPISGARVQYSIERRRLNRWWWRWWGYEDGSTVAEGELTTAADGSFDIAFTPEPDSSIELSTKPSFEYVIRVDVTDLNGESHPASTSMRVGYRTAFLSLEGGEEVGTLDGLKPKYIDINGTPLPGKVDIKIERLRQPEAPLLDAPAMTLGDHHTLGEAEFRKAFPLFAYGKDYNDRDRWAVVSRGWKGESGVYRITLVAEGADTAVEYRTVTTPDARKVQSQKLLWVGESQGSVEVGETYRLRCGSRFKDVEVYYLLRVGNKERDFKRIRISDELKEIAVPVDSAMLGGFQVDLVAVREGIVEHVSKRVSVPFTHKKLNVEIHTFRDKLLPGEQEEWTIKVKGERIKVKEAAMVMTMYDDALNSYGQQPWGFSPWRSNGSMGLSVLTLHGNMGNWMLNPKYEHYRGSQPTVWNLMEALPHYSRWGRGRIMYKAAAARNSMVTVSMEAVEEEAAFTVVEDNAVPMAAMGAAMDADEGVTGAAPEPVQVRQNLNTLAFFATDLRTDADGIATYRFTVPELLTRWNVKGLAFTKDIKIGTLDKTLVTQKPLMVQPNLPRFLRHGDSLALMAKVVVNEELRMKNEELHVEVNFLLTDAATGDTLCHHTENVLVKDAAQVMFPVEVPRNVYVATYRIVAQAEGMSDGEQGQVPVVSSRQAVTVSQPLYINGKGEKAFTFPLSTFATPTAEPHLLAAEVVSDPIWLAVKAMPYLQELESPSNLYLANRLYVNSLGKKVLDNLDILESLENLEKLGEGQEVRLKMNEDVKQTLLQATPWVRDAQSEQEQRQAMAAYFDQGRIDKELSATASQLAAQQNGDGGWSWMPSGESSAWITQQILKKLSAVANMQSSVKELALKYIDREEQRYYDRWIKPNLKKGYDCQPTNIDYLYTRSFYGKGSTEAYKYYYANALKRYRDYEHLYTQAQLALVFQRAGDTKQARDLIRRLKEKALTSDEMGTYWRDNRSGWWWYQRPIETQALLIQAFSEVTPKDTAFIGQMQQWLLKQKQTTHWGNDEATVKAIDALMVGSGSRKTRDSRNSSFSRDSRDSRVSSDISLIVCGAEVTAQAEGLEGYRQKRWTGSELDTILAHPSETITLRKETAGIAWGGVYYQYTDDMDKIPASESGITLRRTYHTPLPTLKVGDRVKVRIDITCDRHMEYLELIDGRPSCVGPLSTEAGWHWNDGLRYYITVGNTDTRCYIDRLEKGRYWFEYEVYVTNPGTFLSGPVTMQCMYAPEFRATAPAQTLHIDPAR